MTARRRSTRFHAARPCGRPSRRRARRPCWGRPPSGAGPAEPTAGALGRSPKRYRMKKSINLWAFPYPAADDACASACNSPRTPASTASS